MCGVNYRESRARGSGRVGPQGSQAEWERVHTEMIQAALQGIIACSEEDADGLADAVAQIGSFNRAGHGQFR